MEKCVKRAHFLYNSCGSFFILRGMVSAWPEHNNYSCAVIIAPEHAVSLAAYLTTNKPGSQCSHVCQASREEFFSGHIKIGLIFFKLSDLALGLIHLCL